MKSRDFLPKLATLLAYVSLACALVTGASAHADPTMPCSTPSASHPSTAALVAAGSAMGIAEYFLGVIKHEGSHALAGTFAGAKVTEFLILPKRMPDGYIRFGETRLTGMEKFTDTDRVLFNLAPKITDVGIMGLYTLLLEGDALPKNKYAQLSLLVVATSAWVDFTKNVATTRYDDDTVKIYNLIGATTESQRLPFRVLHGTLALGGAIEIGRGFYKLFKNEERIPASSPAVRKISTTVQPLITPSMVGVGGTF